MLGVIQLMCLCSVTSPSPGADTEAELEALDSSVCLKYEAGNGGDCVPVFLTLGECFELKEGWCLKARNQKRDLLPPLLSLPFIQDA